MNFIERAVFGLSNGFWIFENQERIFKIQVRMSLLNYWYSKFLKPGMIEFNLFELWSKLHWIAMWCHLAIARKLCLIPFTFTARAFLLKTSTVSSKQNSWSQEFDLSAWVHTNICRWLSGFSVVCFAYPIKALAPAVLESVE